MSLFDVLRYPIDIDFHEEDLSRIPSKILKEWWIECIEIRDKVIGNDKHRWMIFLGENINGMSRFMFNIRAPSIRDAALKALQRRLNEMDE